MLTNRNRHITLHCEIAVYEFCFVMILRICFERMYEGILYVPCCCLYCSDNCLGTVFYLSVSSTWGRSYSLLMLRWSLTNCFVLSFRHLKSYNWLLFSSFNQWPKPLETIFFFFLHTSFKCERSQSMDLVIIFTAPLLLSSLLLLLWFPQHHLKKNCYDVYIFM